MRGQLFGDGSCARHVIDDYSRAGFCLQQIGPDGQVQVEVQCPVWAPLPQSAPAAEHCAIGTAHQLAIGDSVYHGDCKGALDSYSGTSGVILSDRLMYAGVVNSHLCFGKAEGSGGESVIKQYVKVKAHQDVGNFEGIERWRAEASASVDLGAKNALDLHEPSKYLDTVNAAIVTGRRVCRVIAQVWKLWPRLPRGERLPGLALAAPPKPKKPQHLCVRVRGRSRCSECHRTAFTRETRIVYDNQGCSEFSAGTLELAKAFASHDSHSLWVATLDDGAKVYVCKKCGAYGILRAVGLVKTCQQRPQSSGRKAALKGIFERGVSPLEYSRHRVVTLERWCSAPGRAVAVGGGRLAALRERAFARVGAAVASTVSL